MILVLMVMIIPLQLIHILENLMEQVHKDLLAVQQVMEITVRPVIVGAVLILEAAAVVLVLMVRHQLVHLQKKVVLVAQEKIMVLCFEIIYKINI